MLLDQVDPHDGESIQSRFIIPLEKDSQVGALSFLAIKISA